MTHPPHTVPARAANAAHDATDPEHRTAASENAPGSHRKSATELFRGQALRARQAELVQQPLPEIHVSLWYLLGLLGTAIGVLAVVGALARIEVTIIARGRWMTGDGPRTVTSRVEGTLSQWLVTPGDAVEAGQLLGWIDAPAAAARVEQAVLALELAREDAATGDAAARSFEQRGLSDLRRALTSASTTSGSTRPGLDAARARLELADREREMALQQAERDRQLRRAAGELEAARATLKLGEIRAPETGRLESLRVARGEQVSSGVLVARVLPRTEPWSIVAFVPATQATHARAGLAATIEIEAADGSYREARATVARVSPGAAEPVDVARTMGPGFDASAPLVRLVLEVDPASVATGKWEALQPGASVLARLHLRTERLIFYLFEFSRRWLRG